MDNLPIVVTRSPELVRLLTKINNIINPDKLLITEMDTISIEYKSDIIQRLINIKVLDKERIDEVRKIKDWC